MAIPTQSEQAIDRNVRLTILRMKRQGTVGASVDYLRLNAPTKGVDVHPSQYNSMFAEIAVKIAKQLKFDILDDGTWAAITRV